MNTNVKEIATQPTVLDPVAEQLGRLYAQALLGAAKKTGEGDAVVDQLQSLVAALREHRVLHEVFASPRVSSDEKVRVIERLVSGKISPTLLKFLKVAAHRGRLAYLAEISQAAIEMRDDVLGRVVAHVRTATPLDEQTRQQVKAQLSSTVNREVVLRESVDPSLIGGIVVRIGDTVYDASIANRLDRMGQNLKSSFASRLAQQASRFFSGEVAS